VTVIEEMTWFRKVVSTMFLILFVFGTDLRYCRFIYMIGLACTTLIYLIQEYNLELSVEITYGGKRR